MFSILALITMAPPSEPARQPVIPRRIHYFTCRPGYEQCLQDELSQSKWATSVHGTALVRAEAPEPQKLGHTPDPAYALQVLPRAFEVSGASIRVLAANVADALQATDDLRELLSAGPRGSLVLHALVPDLLRGVPSKKAKLLRRCEAVADEVCESLRVRYPCARRHQATGAADGGCAADDSYALVLQLLLLDPESLVVSLERALERPGGLGRWPSLLPAGLADSDVTDRLMPSSAYRKLIESFACLETTPAASARCVDLGACPGGWTAALRRYGCTVTAVDRSPLAPDLMQDGAVTFVQGDAFSFEPPTPVDWLVSDVIAYPERVSELLERWCTQRWAAQAVVTMKFQGDPDWGALQRAVGVAEKAGYAVRVKHFFSNKNEVTLMMRALDGETRREGVG